MQFSCASDRAMLDFFFASGVLCRDLLSQGVNVGRLPNRRLWLAVGPERNQYPGCSLALRAYSIRLTAI